ncbi:MAG: YARHG domain-containing protein [Bacteroidales bacterium]|nr:YARHG domain-containing protein [Bacteroidales bacterium]
MKKVLIFILATILMLQMTACSIMQSKQLEGTWETTVPYYDNENDISGDFVYRFTFKRDNTSGGKMELVFSGEISVIKFAAKIKGDWDVSSGTLNMHLDYNSVQAEQNIFASDFDLEGMLRSEIYELNGGGANIIELNDRVLKLQNGESSMTFNRIYEISTEQAYTGDKYEQLWIEASERALTYDDISDFSKQDRRILRNYFYARLNVKFKSQDLQEFFSQYSWYKPVYNDASLVEIALTDIQKQNIRFLKENE